ncbi:MAG: nickel-responsive transcriptional regulator NikR [Burkholderiales bacterium]|nr:nickel-responsive transcriptional regulator NikR [Burkholderiales bacterium]
MQRFTISLDEELAEEFDKLINQRGYVNRSEAVRDLIRQRLGSAVLDAHQAKWCVATVSYVYDHHEHAVTARLMDLQHEHHDLVISSLHTHLDHDNCMETVILRGPTLAVQDCAGQLTALRGVRHGQVHLLPLNEEGRHHHHSRGAPKPHTHLKPVN